MLNQTHLHKLRYIAEINGSMWISKNNPKMSYDHLVSAGFLTRSEKHGFYIYSLTDTGRIVGEALDGVVLRSSYAV